MELAAKDETKGKAQAEVPRRDNHRRPTDWKVARFWKDDQLWTHPVDINESDPVPVHGRIPSWVYERRKQTPPTSGGQQRWEILAEGYNLTDLGNAERLVSRYGPLIHYCHDYKCWLIWDGKRWERDTGAKIASLAKWTIRKIYYEAGDEPDEKRRKELAEHGKKSESDHRINAMIHCAESEPGVPIRAQELDSDQWLFNVLNGTINLKTGQLLEHDAADLGTILVPIEYIPGAECPMWLNFLNQVTDNDQDRIGYLQRALGYSLVGDTTAQVVFFLWGLGNNGKSTFITIARKLTGGYGGRVNSDLFMLKDKAVAGPKEGLADLRGKRFICASELEDGRQLATVLIKDLTGGETIKADRKYEHEIEFQPTAKLWLCGNHKPVIKDTTISIWRRMKLIPFNYSIPADKVDPELPAKLETELPGVLAWAVEGCLDWQKQGLAEPPAITTATAFYRHDQDILGDFIEDCCVLEELATVPKVELKDAYHDWCKSSSLDPVTQRTFKNRLIERGVGEGRMGRSRYWRRIRLRREEDSDKTSEDSDKTLPGLGVTMTRGDDFPGSSTRKGIQEKFLENRVQDVTSKLTDESLVTKVLGGNDIPEYPHERCSVCGGDDYQLTSANQWLCSKCHPRAKERNK